MKMMRKTRKSRRSVRNSINFESSNEDDISFEEPSSTSSDNDGFNQQLVDILRERIEYEPYVPSLVVTTTTAEEGDPTPSITNILEDENDEIKIIMVRNEFSSIEDENERKKRASSMKQTTDEKRRLDEEMKRKAQKDGDTQKSVIKKIANSELDYLYDLIVLKENFSDPILLEKKILSKEVHGEVFSPFTKILELHYRIGDELDGKEEETEESVSLIDTYFIHVEEFSQIYLDLFVKYSKIIKTYQQQMHCNQEMREFVEKEEKIQECSIEELFKLPFKKLSDYREHMNKLTNWVKEEEDISKLQSFLACIRSLQEQQEIFCTTK